MKTRLALLICGLLGTAFPAFVARADAPIDRFQTFDQSAQGSYSVHCYGNPFTPDPEHYCVGEVSIGGSMAMAAGGIWGELTVLSVAGSVRDVGREGECRAKFEGVIYPGGRIVADSGALRPYLIGVKNYGKGPTDDDVAWCAFPSPLSHKIYKAMLAGTVYTQPATRPDFVNRFGPDVLIKEGIDVFVTSVPRYTTSRCPSMPSVISPFDKRSQAVTADLGSCF